MADRLPLLVFPRAHTILPSKGKGFPSDVLHFPDHAKQVERLSPQLTDLKEEFSRYKADVSGSATSLEPEMVLVIEIAGSVNDFQGAVEKTNGLEWLGEWEIEDIEPDDDFYEPTKFGLIVMNNRPDSSSGSI